MTLPLLTLKAMVPGVFISNRFASSFHSFPNTTNMPKNDTSKTRMNSPILTIQLIKIHYSSTSKLTKLIHVYSLLKADKTTNPHYL